MKINYPAVVVSAIAYWILGALWYSPLLFARPFIALMRWTPEQVAAAQAAGGAKQIGVALLTSLLLATSSRTSSSSRARRPRAQACRRASYSGSVSSRRPTLRRLCSRAAPSDST